MKGSCEKGEWRIQLCVRQNIGVDAATRMHRRGAMGGEKTGENEAWGATESRKKIKVKQRSKR